MAGTLNRRSFFAWLAAPLVLPWLPKPKPLPVSGIAIVAEARRQEALNRYWSAQTRQQERDAMNGLTLYWTRDKNGYLSAEVVTQEEFRRRPMHLT